MNNCPCGSNTEYSKCCGQYIDGDKTAPTAESLMRSRYTAYTLAKIDYIAATMTRPLNRKQAKTWAKNSKWLGLTILNTKQGLADDSIGWVEFLAELQDKDGKQQLHELSEFHKINGVWIYTSGIHNPKEA